MQLRDFTQDFTVFKEVYLENEYRLPDWFDSEDVIVDVGAHVGCFAMACIKRGARNVLCYEPEPENFTLLRKNLGPYPHLARPRNAAVWRSDKAEQARLIRSNSEIGHTAMHQVLTGAGDIVPTISLDAILKRCDQVRLLKLDCEGSEYPILYTSKELHRVQEIVGESHEAIKWAGCPFECSNQGIVDFLNRNGFSAWGAQGFGDPKYVNLFFARRVS